MNYHNPKLFNWPTLNKLISATFIIIIFSYSSVKAQYSSSDSQYGVSIGTDYDVPVGNFSYTFKPAINYNLNLFHHYGDFTASFSAGYHIYKPKADTFYYQKSETDYGKIQYQNFPVYSFYLGATYDLALTEQLKAYGGINMGIYYTHYVFQSTDFDADLNEQDLYLAPRLGISYMLTNNVGIGIEGKYNFFAPTGDARYDDRVGTLYNSYSVGFRLIYNFN